METRRPSHRPTLEERERAILGGATLRECVTREGGGFWLRLSDEQTIALKRLYDTPDGKTDPANA